MYGCCWMVLLLFVKVYSCALLVCDNERMQLTYRRRQSIPHGGPGEKDWAVDSRPPHQC